VSPNPMIGPSVAERNQPSPTMLRCMQSAPFIIIISGKRYECRVAGNTEAEAADTAELIMHQLRQQDRVWPARVNIECRDFEAAKRLAAYFAAITVEPNLD
jgi:transcriptional regulator NrdR family protein